MYAVMFEVNIVYLGKMEIICSLTAYNAKNDEIYIH